MNFKPLLPCLILVLGLQSAAQADDRYEVVENGGFQIRVSREALRVDEGADCIDRQLKQLAKAATPSNLARLREVGLTAMRIELIQTDLLVSDFAYGPEALAQGHELVVTTHLSSSWFGIEGSRPCGTVQLLDIDKLLRERKASLDKAAADEAKARAVVAATEKLLKAVTGADDLPVLAGSSGSWVEGDSSAPKHAPPRWNDLPKTAPALAPPRSPGTQGVQ